MTLAELDRAIRVNLIALLRDRLIALNAYHKQAVDHGHVRLSYIQYLADKISELENEIIDVAMGKNFDVRDQLKKIL